MRHHELSALRRYLHANAEPGFLEYVTAATVVAELRARGVPHRLGAEVLRMDAVGDPPSAEDQAFWAERAREAGVASDLIEQFAAEGTAIVADVRGNRPGPVWGLRVDLDALPIKEHVGPDHVPTAEGFASTTPYMHACGHDGHTAIGIALAARLSDGDFPGTVRIVFQPAEEGVRGAAPMIAAGAVSDVDRMLAVHLRSSLPVGTVVGGVDNAMATTKWRARFTGEPAHASAAPEKGRNALAAAAQATLALLGISRFAASDTRVNVGTFHAGGGANIIPAQAELTYEVRARTNAVLDDLNGRAQDIVEGAARMYGVTSTTARYGEASTSLPDPLVLRAVRNAAATVSSITDNVGRASAAGGSDDAHSMISTVQARGGVGAYLMVGARSVDVPHHHHRFDFDERALDIATDLLEAVFRGREP